jgi:N-sulfoglucosamine sulfohydrolase
MHSRKCISFLALPGLLLTPFACGQTIVKEDFPETPNIILIIADDMAWDDSGAYGHPFIRTPNIDRLAKEGMKFNQAFLTTSSCSPSRASIITGLYPHQTDAEQLHWPIPADKTTIIELLNDAGYWTALAGKRHIGNAVLDRFDFLASERSFIELEGIENIELPPDDKSGCHLWRSTLKVRPANKPFFLWLAASDPHRPYESNIIPEPHTINDVVLPPYMPDDPQVREDFVQYYDEIWRLDYYVGEILNELEDQGIHENTLVLFISDNGRPFARDKTTLYDSGIKTPFILRWPEVVSPGSVCDALVSAVDIAPTFLMIAGIKPDDQMEGKDFRPLLKMPKAHIREFVFAQAHWHDVERMYRGVRDTRYKYIRNFYPDLPNTPPADALKSPSYEKLLELKEKGELNEYQMTVFIAPTPKEELFDTWNDPHELINLAYDSASQNELIRMRTILEEYMIQLNDTIPTVRTPDEYDRRTGDPLPARQWPRPGKFP